MATLSQGAKGSCRLLPTAGDGSNKNSPNCLSPWPKSVLHVDGVKVYPLLILNSGFDPIYVQFGVWLGAFGENTKAHRYKYEACNVRVHVLSICGFKPQSNFKDSVR